MKSSYDYSELMGLDIALKIATSDPKWKNQEVAEWLKKRIEHLSKK